MPSDFEIRGAEDFLRVSKALKAAGEKDLRTALNKGIRQAVKPVQKQAAETLAAAMPSPELERKARRVTQRTQTRTGKDAGITVGVPFRRGGKGLGASNARLINQRGVIRHPVYGNRDVWSSTRVGGFNWFDGTFRRAAPALRREVEIELRAALEAMARRARG